jgi:hypothetical protein
MNCGIIVHLKTSWCGITSWRGSSICIFKDITGSCQSYTVISTRETSLSPAIGSHSCLSQEEAGFSRALGTWDEASTTRGTSLTGSKSSRLSTGIRAHLAILSRWWARSFRSEGLCNSSGHKCLIPCSQNLILYLTKSLMSKRLRLGSTLQGALKSTGTLWYASIWLKHRITEKRQLQPITAILLGKHWTMSCLLSWESNSSTTTSKRRRSKRSGSLMTSLRTSKDF